jgi:urease accessory protein UreF
VRHAYADPLVDLDEQLHAMVLPREARDASHLIGTSLLRGARELASDARLDDFALNGRHHHLPIVFGALAYALRSRD